ncbi:hypothetical protein [Streptomyces sp. NBC_00102]|uniref:DUF7507 domain-containing protein n=1 Tax=Streptomyces sp. NBC_00102 TaxID=2975652 RepID=UPI00224C8B52|nr:hypothetical protein [Streptomyces sp. NBC_00102]MCX5401986.1 hypothetical protein [Streptomyces sp. NBC_00102]
MRHMRSSMTRRGRVLGRWTAGGLGALGLAAAGLGLPTHAAAAPTATAPTAAAQAVGVPLVDETFTGATAIAGFEAFGPACLTGAPEGPAPGPGTHPLTGCPTGATGPVPPNDAAPNGYLRLTDASRDQSAAVLYNHALPANQGLVTTFDQWQYGATTNPPADGISFFLIDGAASLTAPGAFGGSLGYAQKLPDDDPDATFLPGVNRGYVGVGLDVLGNYFGDWEHRGNGCATRSPAGTAFRVPAPGANMVTLRGPGDGTEGYCFLDATTSNFSATGPWPSTLPGQLQGPTASVPPDSTPLEAEALLEPSRRTVTVEISPSPDPLITVAIDFHDGNGTQQVLSTPAPQPMPDTFKFGFAASTGLFTDVHLIRNLTVHPAAALPQLNLVKQVSQEPPLQTPLAPGDQVPYEYVVTNTGTVPLTGVTVTDDRVTGVSCPQSTLAVGETMTCTGTYTVTAADGTAGSVTNTATAQGQAGTTPVESPPDDVTLPVQAGPGVRLEKSADDTEVYRVGDEVTYTYTVTNTGPQQLTGVGVTDDRVSPVTCLATTLAPAGQPGDSTTCTGTYTITEADAVQGSVTNVATAHGQSGTTPVESPPDDVTLVVASELSLTLDKSADDTRVYQAGDEVTYTYTVTNSGDTTLTDVTVTDDLVTDVTCDSTTLAPGATTTCTGTYTITAADAARGTVTNLAAAAGQAGGTRVVSPPDDVTLRTQPQGEPGLRLVKSVDDARRYQVGDAVTYTYTVTNTGPSEVTGVTVTDDHVSGVTCAETTLAPAGLPGDSTTCTGTYTVTGADAERGSVVNIAVATAENGTVQSNRDRARITVGKKQPCHHCEPKPCDHDAYGDRKPCHDERDAYGEHDPQEKQDEHGVYGNAEPCHGRSGCRTK